MWAVQKKSNATYKVSTDESDRVEITTRKVMKSLKVVAPNFIRVSQESTTVWRMTWISVRLPSPTGISSNVNQIRTTKYHRSAIQTGEKKLRGARSRRTEGRVRRQGVDSSKSFSDICLLFHGLTIHYRRPAKKTTMKDQSPTGHSGAIG